MPDSSQIGALPTKLEFEKSLMFFHAYMYGPIQGKLRIYGARKVSWKAVAMPSDWEVFGSMLVDDLGQKLAAGVDLTNYEVKSAKRTAKRKGGYEYQYHKISGRGKLIEDAKVGHLFFEYSENLREVDLRYMHGSDLSFYFEKWLEEFPVSPEDYEGDRFRRQIPYGVVKKKGKLLMALKDGEVVFPETTTTDTPAQEGPEETDGEIPEE